MVILDKILKKQEWDTGIYAFKENFPSYLFPWNGNLCLIAFIFLVLIISLEVEMIEKAHKLGLLTTPYAFNQDEAVEMAKAGADIVVAHMGLTTSGSIGAKTSATMEESTVRVQAIADAAHRTNPNVIVLCHGGII
jgi:predicted TIM-barrel enzyme